MIIDSHSNLSNSNNFIVTGITKVAESKKGQSQNHSHSHDRTKSSNTPTVSVPVSVQVERRMVTYAQWARRGEPNPEKLTMTSRLVRDLR